MPSVLSPSPFAVLSVLMLGSLLLPSCGAGSNPQIVPPGEINTHLDSLWNSVLKATPDDKPANKKREWQMHLTTWLPDEWPPSPKTTWTRYAYGLDMSMDGSSDVSAPFARIEHRAGDDARETFIPMAGKLKVIAIHPVRPHGGWRYTLDDEKRMLKMALSLTSAPPADARGAAGLKCYFQSWRLGSAEIAAHVGSRHRAFFKWLASEP
jgi:hypothetical protein